MSETTGDKQRDIKTKPSARVRDGLVVARIGGIVIPGYVDSIV